MNENGLQLFKKKRLMVLGLISFLVKFNLSVILVLAVSNLSTLTLATRQKSERCSSIR
jgi:hypothetical protein